MVSTIDITKPVQGSPTTESVRFNFQAAYNEITALQNQLNTNPYLPLAGGVMTGPVSNFNAIDGITIYDAVDLGGPFHLKSGSVDKASITGNNVVLDSWNGIGFGNRDAVGQRIPAGFQGVNINVRTGNIIVHGIGEFRSQQVNEVTRIGHVRFFRDTNNAQNINLVTGYYTSLDPTTPIPNGGTGINANDRFYDIYDNIYTVLTVDVPNGAATSIRIDSSPRGISATFPNPIALTPCPGFTGTGLTVNLIATQCPKLLIGTSGAGTTLEFTCPAGINFTNNVTVTGTLTTTLAQIAGTNTTNGSVTINGTMNGNRQILYQTAGVTRWRWYLFNNEPGDNTGCDLYLQRYNDAGTSLGNLIFINRSTGLFNYTGDLTVNGWLTTGTNTVSGAVIINGPVGSGRQVRFQTAGGERWRLGLTTAAEGGSNAGSDYILQRYSDAGALLSTVFTISRASGLMTLSGNMIATSFLVGSASGPTWTTGTGAPGGTPPIGSLYSRTDGAVGTTLYVRGASAWAAVAGV